MMRLVAGLCLIAILCLSYPLYADESANAAETVAKSEDAHRYVEGDIDVTDADFSEIKILQPRKVSTSKRFEIAFGMGVVPSDLFMTLLPIKLILSYHFDEAWGIELNTSYSGCFSSKVGSHGRRSFSEHCLRFESTLGGKLKKDYYETTRVRDFKLLSKTVLKSGVNAVWSPFFGKIALFNRSILHFNLHVAAGIGYGLEEYADDGNKVRHRSTAVGTLGFGFAMYFMDFMGVRIDFREYLSGKRRGGLATASELSLLYLFLIP